MNTRCISSVRFLKSKSDHFNANISLTRNPSAPHTRTIRLYGSGNALTTALNSLGVMIVIDFSRFDDPLISTSSIGFRPTGMYSQSIARSSRREMRFRALTFDAAPKDRPSIHFFTSPAVKFGILYSLHFGLTWRFKRLLLVFWVLCLSLGNSSAMYPVN